MKLFLMRIWNLTGGPSSAFLHGVSHRTANFEFREKAMHKEVAFRCCVPFRHRLMFLLGYAFSMTGECDYKGQLYKFRFDFQTEKIEKPETGAIESI